MKAIEHVGFVGLGLIGAPMARVTPVITVGSPIPEALYTATSKNTMPWLEVAV